MASERENPRIPFESNCFRDGQSVDRSLAICHVFFGKDCIEKSYGPR